jgi:ABC-type antimicrobial peptide transport system permease subunit
VGGLIGIALTLLLINGGVGPFLEQTMPGMFPYFKTPATTLLVGLLLAAVLGTLAATVPAIRASRLKVTDALRRID